MRPSCKLLNRLSKRVNFGANMPIHLYCIWGAWRRLGWAMKNGRANSGKRKIIKAGEKISFWSHGNKPKF